MSPEGFEPPTHGLEGRCSIQLSYGPTLYHATIRRSSKKMERMMRIELTLPAWKAGVLPLNYIRVMERKTRFELATLALARRCSTPEPLPHKLVEGDEFEPSKAQLTDLQSAPFGHSGIPPQRWSWRSESNQQPADYKSAALPLSHASKIPILFTFQNGDPERARTVDLQRDRLAF